MTRNFNVCQTAYDNQMPPEWYEDEYEIIEEEEKGMDMILRDCGSVGWLGLVEIRGVEKYRTGRHYPHKDECLCAINEWLNEREEEC